MRSLCLIREKHFVLVGCIVVGLLSCLVGCKQATDQLVTLSSSKTFQLSNPLIITKKKLFKDSTTVRLERPYPGAILWFQSEGINTQLNSTPKAYSSPIILSENTKLLAYATHPDYKTSDTVALEVYKIKQPLNQAQISVFPPANDAYPGKGAATLINSTKGPLSFRNSEEWLGFNQPVVRIDLVFEKAIVMNKVYISSLIDQDAWIFPPTNIIVKHNNTAIGTLYNKEAGQPLMAQLKTFIVDIPIKSYTQLSIEIAALNNIPEWHPGKGTQSWLFIDQILVE